MRSESAYLADIRAVLDASEIVEDCSGLGDAIELRPRNGRPRDRGRLICVVRGGVDAHALGSAIASVLSLPIVTVWRLGKAPRALLLCAKTGRVRIAPTSAVRTTRRLVPTIASIVHDFHVPTSLSRRGPRPGCARW